MSINQPIPPSFNLPEPVDASASTPSQPANVVNAQVAPQPTAAASASVQYGDNLSQEWIHAVENAIRQNIDDPHGLSAHIDELRAQYIAGRYAKEVKRQAGKGK